MKKVDDYIQKQPSSQKEILTLLRKLIHDTIPGIKEDFRFGAPWYEDKFYLAGLKDSVNLGFSIQGLSHEEQDLFIGTGKYMRHRKYKNVEEIDPKEISNLLSLVYHKATPYHQ